MRFPSTWKNVMPEQFGKILVVLGLIIAGVGGIFLLLQKMGVSRLPGDIQFTRGNFSFSFPIVTCIIVSIVLSVVLNLFFKR